MHAAVQRYAELQGKGLKVEGAPQQSMLPPGAGSPFHPPTTPRSNPTGRVIIDVPLSIIRGFSMSEIGKRCTVALPSGPKVGTLKWVGLHPVKKEPRVGVIFDSPVGMNDGTLATGGQVYRFFSCPPKYGVIAFTEKVRMGGADPTSFNPFGDPAPSTPANANPFADKLPPGSNPFRGALDQLTASPAIKQRVPPPVLARSPTRPRATNKHNPFADPPGGGAAAAVAAAAAAPAVSSAPPLRPAAALPPVVAATPVSNTLAASSVPSSAKKMAMLSPAGGFGNDLGNGYVEVMPDADSDDEATESTAKEKLYKEFAKATENDNSASFEGIMDDVLNIEASESAARRTTVYGAGPISVLPRDGSAGETSLKADLAKLKGMLSAGEINENTYASACDRAIMISNITDLLETGKITGQIYTQALVAALGNSTAANKYAAGKAAAAADSSEA